jgi:hypothetical protein
VRVFLAIGLLLAISCSPTSSALHITVKFGPNSRAQCVRVVVTPRKGGASESTAAMPRGAKEVLNVGVVRTRNLVGEVTAQALGFVAKDCNETTLNEESNIASGSLDMSSLQQLEVTLDGPTAALDADGDHYRAGPDCLDTNPLVHPGQVETRCTDGLDDDCAGGIDCADSACAGVMPCTGLCTGASGVCTSPGLCEQSLGACVSGKCEYPVDLGASCGPKSFCRADKSCALGEGNCLDGLDNDGDTLADCADADCSAQPCDKGAPCIQPGSCVSQVCVKGSPVQCPSGQSCVGDAGCVSPETGIACANGKDDDADGLTDCADPGCASATCEDGNACTTGQTCSAGTCGGGASVICNSPGECQVPGACQVDGGCGYPHAPAGSPCDGGVCAPNGTCGVFPFVPSNFVPSAFVPDASVLLDCIATLNTDSATNPFESWCGPKPEVSLLAQDGGPEVMVLSMRNLTVEAGLGAYIYGRRPVLFAVYGDATLGSGSLLAPVANPDGGVSWPAGYSPPVGMGTGPLPHCLTGTGANGKQPGLSTGGGGGGAFGTAGADGGDGFGSPGSKGGGGAPNGNELLIPLRGGCAGGNGGPTSVDRGGVGGGAIQISVAGHLTVAGRIGSPGYGGTGGNSQNNANGAAGGGGSGGGVLLEAWQMEFLAGGWVTANGGGGGEGDGDNSDSAFVGASAPRALVAAAVGGVGADGTATANGGPGGAGSNGQTPATVGINANSYDNACGGGGGGGAGRVRLNAYASCASNGATFTGVVTSNRLNCP